MSLEELSSRAISAEFFRAMEDDRNAVWAERISTPVFNSDQDAETYVDVFDVPALTEWLGDRAGKNLGLRQITISNVDYESSLLIRDKDLRRDKSDQIMLRVNGLAGKARVHWNQLLTDLITAGSSTTGWSPDNQNFYSTSHSEGSSGTQSNLLTISLASLPVVTTGSPAAPSAAAMAFMILEAIAAIGGFLDPEGEPMNEEANAFQAQVPTTLWAAAQASKRQLLEGGAESPIFGMDIDIVQNPRLNASFTDRFIVSRRDGMAFIRQEEEPLRLITLGPGTTFFETNRKTWLYGIDVTRGAGYGLWQHSVLVDIDA